MSYAAFFLNTKASIVRLELIEISHPNFSKTYYIVRNAVAGVTVTHEDATVHTYDYYPVQLTPTGAENDLDQTMQINFGDLGEILPQELDNVAAADGFGTNPIMKYREYRSDDLTHVLNGPYEFELRSLAFKKEGATFEATAHRLNLNTTGEIYTTDRFPMLAGFL